MATTDRPSSWPTSAQLDDLAKTAPAAADPALLDALPYLGDLLAGAPLRLPLVIFAPSPLAGLLPEFEHACRFADAAELRDVDAGELRVAIRQR